MRNSYKYTLMYSGAEPEFIEGDVFKIIIPLSVGSMTKVGPGTSPVASGEVGGEVSGEVISVKLDKSDYWIPVVPLGEPRVSFFVQLIDFSSKIE